MKKLINNEFLRRIVYLVIFLIYLIPFSDWILRWGSLSATDFSYNFFSTFKDYTLHPYLWNPTINAGFGGNLAYALWTYFFWAIPLNIGILFRLPWEIIERLFFFYPMLLLGFCIPLIASRKLFPKNNYIFLISPIIFMLNTYILMLIGGGQNIIVTADLIAFLLVVIFMTQINEEKSLKNTLSYSILYGFFLGIEMMLDLRFFYITLIILFLYFLFEHISYESKVIIFLTRVRIMIPSLFVAVSLNAFWIIPLLFNKKSSVSQLGDAYFSVNAVKFLSFNKFEYGLSLLHPNWPENIFGKVDFIRPEFLVLPIFAFSSLLLIKGENKKIKINVLFLSLLALLGVFLAKGTNDPFGGVYIWLFQYFPGFSMFRDSTKWYLLIVIAYTLLIPFTLGKISEGRIISKLLGKYSLGIIGSLFGVYLIFLVRPAYLGDLTGTFKSMPVPEDYKLLESQINSSSDFSRILWIPTSERFAPNNYNHPFVSGYDYFKVYDPRSVVKVLARPETQKQLQLAAIKYIIVPQDFDNSIFLADRKINLQQKSQVIDAVKALPWLREQAGYKDIHVFELSEIKNHFWSTLGENVNYQYIKPSKYIISSHKQNELIVFSESYDSGWVAITNNGVVHSKIYAQRYNSFLISNPQQHIEILYQPQIWADRGLVITIFTAVVLILLGGYRLLSVHKFRIES